MASFPPPPTQGCTRGRHSNEKPQEPLRPEVSSEKAETKPSVDIIYQGPKSAEALERDRPRCVCVSPELCCLCEDQQ